MNSFDRKLRFQGRLPAIDYINESIDYTKQRMTGLGVEDTLLLDPDDVMDNQVAVLRCNFLQAERSALPFNPEDPNFWRIIRARIQPIVLAYSTHEKFVQSMDANVQDNRVDALMQIYRERLDNSERFRKFFFELNDKISREVDSIRNDENEVHDHRSQYDGSGDVANIQRNVISQLEKTIKEYAKREKNYVKALNDKSSDGGPSKEMLEEMQSLRSRLENMSEENLQLKIALDAAQRSQVTQSGEQKDISAAGENADDKSADIDSQMAESVERRVVETVAGDMESLQLRVSGLERELESTSDAAYNAFMANSDLGIVILFMLTGFRCGSLDKLGNEVVRSVGTYGVNPTLRVKVGREYIYFNQGNVPSDVEERFTTMESKGKIASDKTNYFIFEGECALMAEGMPINDVEKCGRLKDNLGTLMQGAAASLNLIVLAGGAERQKKQMEQLILRSNDVFARLDANLNKNKLISSRVMQNFGVELRTTLGVAPGDPKSIKLSGIMKKVEDAMTILMNKDELIDPGFVKNISRVAATIKR
ncbi:hypothetical protein A9Q81_25020 [Gammaproteobacteria bacterium 42_54_T18]|nr:hypothetical protein A9Q81_25020 [Gammaproteobacteria bacterium 42_54_T18]